MTENFTHFPGHETSVGVVNVTGAGLRVATVVCGEVRHMAPAAARRLASDLEGGDHAEELRPVIDALRDRATEVEALQGLRDMPVKGSA